MYTHPPILQWVQDCNYLYSILNKTWVQQNAKRNYIITIIIGTIQELTKLYNPHTLSLLLYYIHIREIIKKTPNFLELPIAVLLVYTFWIS